MLADVTLAKRLDSNQGLSFMGDTKGGSFDIAYDLAYSMLLLPNPHGRPNSDVLTPWVNGLDVTRRPREMFIIDFGLSMAEGAAAQYEAPYEYVKAHVLPMRLGNKREGYRTNWWLHVEADGNK